MKNAKCKMQNAKCKMQNAKCRVRLCILHCALCITVWAMHRRTFLSNVAAAPIAAEGISSPQSSVPATPNTVPCPPDRGLCPGDLDAYFSEEKLRGAIAPVDVSGIPFEV